MSSTELIGLKTSAEFDQAYIKAWAFHREHCTQPSMYALRPITADGWETTQIDCPNCAFCMRVEKPTWKSTKPEGKRLTFWMGQPHAAL